MAVFIDGTWLYYSLVAGRGTIKRDAVQLALGSNWKMKYKIDYGSIPNIIARNISTQLKNAGVLRSVKLVGTNMYTSLRADTSISDPREVMVSDCKAANFEVQR